ncbi:MAG: SRPBCC family protein [Chloroflexi bacterium]|nr:SRPBCC family protein [Chloroflexota bacterium]
MAVVETSVVVNTTPEAIEEFSRYADSWPEWFTGVVGVAPSEDYPEVGSTVNVTFEAAGVQFDILMTVTEYVVGEVVSYELSGMATGTMSFYVDYLDDGQQITAHIDYKLPGGVVGQVADVTVVENQVRQNFDSAMDNLYNWIHG